ncbi:MAG: hypothetical protein MK102_11225 [Fuerstiella sp.]|nr:hypothetical protein [Fuerstiella sp.]
MQRLDVIFRTAIVVELVLIATTWRLWLGAAQFPRVPLFAVFLPIPTIVVRIVSLALIVVLLIAATSDWRERSMPGRRISAVMLTLAGLAVCCNQHCLQPWHWLFMLTMLFGTIIPKEDLLDVLRRLLPCIYVFAAVSRFGPDIDSGMNHTIVSELLDFVDLTSLSTSKEIMSWLCLLTTMTELTVGLLLWISRTQQIGKVIAVTLHLVLIAALGPSGLNQLPAVTIWNVFLALWIIFLFPGPVQHQNQTPPSAAVLTTTAFCVIWSILALFGVTDNWTGWQLYSPRPETIQLQVHSDAIADLPASVALFVSETDPLDEWHTVRIDRWSLAAAGVPMYPQARFQLAIARTVISNLGNDDHVRIRLSTPIGPRWWQRTTVEFAGKAAIRKAATVCWLNATAR